MSAIAETFRTLGSARLIATLGLGVGLVAFFMFLVSRLTGPDMTLLYGELSLDDGSRIVAKLDAMAVPYEIRGNGSQILVPGDQVLRLRMTLAGEGLPSGGTVGYELFNDSDGLGKTSFVQNINLVRALEGELSRTIGSLANVDAARVHLVLPRRQLFSREREEPSASIVIKVRGANRFTGSQVQAVQQLVAAAVPGLKPSRVSIVDDSGALLARTLQEGEEGVSGVNAEEMRRSYESHLARTIEDLLERSVGVGKVRAEISAEMDFDRITTESESYDPDGQVVRSTQTVEESADTSERANDNAVTVAGNLPEATPGGTEAAQSASRSTRTEETVNFEISRVVKNHVRESGIINRISAAVLIDGTYAVADDGTKTYSPRSDEEIQQLEKLARSAIGFNAERGDTVELVNMRFAAVEEDWADESPPPLFGLSKNDYFRIAEILVLAVVATLVILLVVRPMVTRLFEALPAPGAGGDKELLSDQSGGGAPALAAPQSATAAAPGAQNEPSEIEQMIDISQVEGRVKESSLKKIGEIVEKHPEETVSIIRNWMFQET